MIGAGGIAAHTQAAQEISLAVIEAQTPSGDVDAPHPASDHRVLRLSMVFGIAAIGDPGIDRLAELEPVETASRLHGGIEIGRRKRQARQRASGSLGKAESIGGSGFLSRDHPASRPLAAPVFAGECDYANHAVPVDDGGPQVVAQSTVSGRILDDLLEDPGQPLVIRQFLAYPLGVKFLLSQKGMDGREQTDQCHCSKNPPMTPLG